MKPLRRSGLLVLIFFFLFTGVSCKENGAEDHYDKGVEYASEGKFIEARDEFEKALKIDPRDSGSKNSLIIIKAANDLKIKKEAVMHIFKGAAFGNKGMLDKSITEYTRALEIDPGNAYAYYNRGRGYHGKNQSDRAVSDYNKAIEIDPKHVDAYNSRGIAYYRNGQHDRAISDFTKAIEIDPKHVDAYINRGSAYDDNGQHDRAIADYTSAIELDPKHAGAYINRGITYLVHLSERTKACADWKRACELGECMHYDRAKSENLCSVTNASSGASSAMEHYNKGIEYANKGMFDSSISEYTRAIDLNPKYVQAYNNRGLVYNSIGQHDMAIQDYSKAIDINPKDVYPYNNRGLAYIDKGQYDMAIEDYSKAIDLNPKHADAYYNRGIAYNGKGQYDMAIEDYSKAIDLNPNYAPAYNNRGLLYFEKLNDKQRGCSDMKSACAFGVCRNYNNSKKRGDCE